MPVAGLDIHRGDQPIAGHPLGDPEHPVASGLDVLAGDQGQQVRGVARARGRDSTCPSSAATAASASRTSSSTSTSRATGSSQSHGGLPGPAYSSSRRSTARTAAASGLPALSSSPDSVHCGSPRAAGSRCPGWRPRRRPRWHPAPEPPALHRPGSPGHDLGVLEQPPGPRVMPPAACSVIRSARWGGTPRCPASTPAAACQPQVSLQPVAGLPVA